LSLPDAVNGAFELFGAASIWGNVATIRRDKQTRGVSKIATAFFTIWGYWNLYYYPSLGQWLSFVGGCAIVTGNSYWLYLMWKYRKA
jgi:hypothetical protein